jgi:hypothetical protein
MSKPFRAFTAFLVLAIATLACVAPIPTLPPTLSSGTAIPPASPDSASVGTAVALTMAALQPEPESTATLAPASTNTSAPGGSAASLPHTFYFLAPDSAEVTQIFRIESDGITQRQVTSESFNVIEYDVSVMDGSVAYVANNQLLYANADGSERRVLVDGGEVDLNNPFITLITSPVFSLDEQSIAYGYKGLQIYSFAADESELILENQIDDLGDGTFVPKELYSPERYSPDGTKLLITLGYYEGASSAIYDPAAGEVVRLTGGEGALICCDEIEWSADSASFHSASSTMGMFSSGLWRVDAATGEVTTLIPGDAGGTYNAAKEAYLAPDGQLYFFFATVTSPEGIFTRSPLQLVRSAPDGVTGRTVVSSEDFSLLNEALWASDASLVVAAVAPSEEIYQGGQAKIVYPDGRPSSVLTSFAQQMKWGP